MLTRLPTILVPAALWLTTGCGGPTIHPSPNDTNNGVEIPGHSGKNDRSTGGGSTSLIPVPQIRITTDYSQYSSPASVKVAVVNEEPAHSIFLAGCAPLSREKQSGSEWIDHGPDSACIWPGTALEVTPNTRVSESIQVAGVGTWRISTRAGVGCTPGEPLSEESCAALFTISSAPFAVGADAGGVSITMDRQDYEVGQYGYATVTNHTADNVFLSGCTQVSRQKLEAGRWIDKGRMTTCVWEGHAIEVHTNTSYTENAEIQFPSTGTWRVAAEYGQGCATNQPLSEARCASLDAAFSQPITVYVSAQRR